MTNKLSGVKQMQKQLLKSCFIDETYPRKEAIFSKKLFFLGRFAGLSIC